MKKPEPMDEGRFQAVVSRRVESAIAYAEQLATDREKATKYARGDISDDLATIPGRSSVVSMDLRDTAMEILPSLMRMYFGQGDPVEFEPKGQEDEEGARQATDYANYIFTKRNNGFMVCWAAFSDALYRRSGPVKVWWDSSESMSAQRYENIDPETFQMMAAAAEESGEQIIDPEADEQGNVSFTLQTVKKDEGMRVEAMPPEELIYTPNAKDLERPLLIGQHTRKTVGELVALGYDYEEMLELSDEGDEFDIEDQARRQEDAGDDGDDDPTAREVTYVEAYTLIDKDGDGIPELRKVCCVGENYKVAKDEIVSDHPFANYVPYPEPHTAEGQSLFDVLKDLVLIRSQLLRLGLDGLGSVITPRQAYRRGAVDLKQLQDARVGGLVGCQDPMSDIVPIQTDKSAPQMAMQAYEQMGAVRQQRTGQNPASAGLTPDILQNTTRIAANEVVQRAQAHVELIARMFGQAHKRMFKLILQGVTHYQNKTDTIRLRGKWVPMDPRTWNPDMDVSTNVGLGNGNVEERMMAAQTVLQIQQAIMQAAGPENPWVNAEKIRKTLFDLVSVTGRPPESYFLSADEYQQMQQAKAQQPQQPPEKDPLVQAEEVKAQAKLQSDARQQDIHRDIESDKMILGAMKEAIANGWTPQQALEWGQILSQVIGAPRVDAGTQMQGAQ